MKQQRLVVVAINVDAHGLCCHGECRFLALRIIPRHCALYQIELLQPADNLGRNKWLRCESCKAAEIPWTP